MDLALATAVTRRIQAELTAAEATVAVWTTNGESAVRLTEADVAAALDHAQRLAGLLQHTEREPRAPLYQALGVDLLLHPVADPPTIRVRSQLCRGGGSMCALVATLRVAP